MSTENTDSRALTILHALALVGIFVGAAGSLGLMLHAGRHNNSSLLVILFTGWVLSPFIALMAANTVYSRWVVSARMTLYILMLFLAAGSLVGYSGVLSPKGTKTAFVFLAVPLVSWLLIVIIIPIAASCSRRLREKKDRV